MKSLELINILSLGNVVVSQPYENQNLMLKNYFLKAETYFLDQIQDEETRNLWIKEFVYSIDSLDSFNYKELNYIFKNEIFKDQDQKNAIFQKIRENSKIYKTFQEQKNKKSRRGKRSLFTEYQRLTIQDWIDRVQMFINNTNNRSNTSESIAGGMGAVAGSSLVTLISTLSSLTGPIGWVAGLISSALIIGFSGLSGHYIGQSLGERDKANDVAILLDELKKILRIALTSNDKREEGNLSQQLKKVIDEINKRANYIIDFNDFYPQFRSINTVLIQDIGKNESNKSLLLF